MYNYVLYRREKFSFPTFVMRKTGRDEAPALDEAVKIAELRD